MNNSTIKAAVVGVGFIGPVHVEALKRNNVSVIGVVGLSPEEAAQRARVLGVPKGYASFEEMLADPEVEVVHLATPNYLHFEQAKAVLKAGKHVVCEKPLAMTTTESAELVALAGKPGWSTRSTLTCGSTRWSTQARHLVQNGEIGDLFILQGSYLQDWLLYPTDWSWRLDPELGGSLRAVADIGSHWLDMLTFITGLRVEAVFADFKTFHPIRKKPAKPVETFTGKILQPEDFIDQPISTEDYASILLRYENGVRGNLTVAQVCAGRKNRLFFEIYGSKSSLVFDSERRTSCGSSPRQSQRNPDRDPLLAPEVRSVASPWRAQRRLRGYLQAHDEEGL